MFSRIFFRFLANLLKAFLSWWCLGSCHFFLAFLLSWIISVTTWGYVGIKIVLSVICVAIHAATWIEVVHFSTAAVISLSDLSGIWCFYNEFPKIISICFPGMQFTWLRDFFWCYCVVRLRLRCGQMISRSLSGDEVRIPLVMKKSTKSGFLFAAIGHYVGSPVDATLRLRSFIVFNSSFPLVVVILEPQSVWLTL